MHYKFNQRLNTPFWKSAREKTDIGDAQLVVDLFKQRAPLSLQKFGTEAGFTAFEPLVFNAYSYDALLYGQNLEANFVKPMMSEAEYQKKVTCLQ